MSEELPRQSNLKQIGESQSDSNRTSMLRFLSKDLSVETQVTEVGQDWYIVLLVGCNGEPMSRQVDPKQNRHEDLSIENLTSSEDRFNVEAEPADGNRRNESESVDEQELSLRSPKLDLLHTEPATASHLNPPQVQPGSYDPATKRLVIGSRRLGKRKCCKASTPCIGTIPIQAEFQQRFNLPSFIHVSICYAEFEEQLEIAAKKMQ